MTLIGGIIGLTGKLLKFGSGFIALFFVIRSDLSFWPGIGLFIGVALAAGLIGFVLQASGLAILAANEK